MIEHKISLDELKACDVARLPATVQELIRVIGLSAALKLTAIYVGTSFLVPQGKTPAGRDAYEYLAEQIGYPEMAALAKHYRGDAVVYIPNCKAAMLAVRNDLIRADFDAYTREESATRAVKKLAQRHRMTDRWVWDIVNSTEVAPKQESLFA